MRPTMWYKINTKPKKILTVVCVIGFTAYFALFFTTVNFYEPEGKVQITECGDSACLDLLKKHSDVIYNQAVEDTGWTDTGRLDSLCRAGFVRTPEASILRIKRKEKETAKEILDVFSHYREKYPNNEFYYIADIQSWLRPDLSGFVELSRVVNTITLDSYTNDTILDSITGFGISCITDYICQDMPDQTTLDSVLAFRSQVDTSDMIQIWDGFTVLSDDVVNINKITYKADYSIIAPRKCLLNDTIVLMPVRKGYLYVARWE